MKNFKSIIAIAIIAILGFSCQKEVIEPIPNVIEKEVKAGDKPTISFTVTGDWSISSDQVWCQFATSGGYLQEMAGGTGGHTITLNITDENNGNQWSTANITMTKDGKKGIIAIIKRHPKELYIKLYDITDTPIRSFKLGYVDWITTRIDGNFRYAAIDIPDWVEVAVKHENGTIETINSITGAPGEQTEVLLRIVNDGEREKSEITEADGHKIIFSDEKGEHTFEFPVTYDGMGKDKLTFVGPTEYYYGWEVSLDGKSFRQTDPVSGATVTFSDKLEYTITAQDNTYTIVYFEKSIERGIPNYVEYKESDRNSWMHFDKQSQALTIDEHSGAPRYGMVIALPSKVDNNIRGEGYKDDIITTDDSSGISLECVSEDYTKYIIAEFVQHDFNEAAEYEGMHAYHSITTLEIPCLPYNDTALAEKYGCETIYKCDFVNPVEGKSPGVIVDPRIESWTTATYEEGIASAEVWLGERQLKMGEGEFYMGEDTNERMAIHLWGPKEKVWNNENMVVLFKVNNEVKKILVVTPPSEEI